MRVSRLAAVLGMVAVAGVLPGAVAGQGVTFHSSTKFHMGGALGAFIARAAAGGAGGGETTYIDGHRMRTDSRDQSTIIDVDAGRIISIYKDKKSYSSMTFEQFADAMRGAQAQMQADMSQQKAKQNYTAATKPQQDNLDWDYTVSAEKTGEHQKIAGYDAQREFITLTATARDQTQPDSGTLVVLMDIWTSPVAPTATATREFQQAYAAKARSTFQPAAQGMGAMMGISPQFKAALAAAGKELHKIHGTQLRTTTYLVAVPENVKFDRNLVVSGGAAPQPSAQASPSPSKGGFGSFLHKMKAAAQEAERSQQNQGSAKSAQQGTVLWFSNEVDDIKTGVPAGAFAIPAGYTLLPTMGAAGH